MKNLFLTCAFVLGTSSLFAGANTNEMVMEVEEVTCIPTTLSCGITGYSCGETLGDIIDIAILADEILC